MANQLAKLFDSFDRGAQLLYTICKTKGAHAPFDRVTVMLTGTLDFLGQPADKLRPEGEKPLVTDDVVENKLKPGGCLCSDLELDLADSGTRFNEVLDVL